MTKKHALTAQHLTFRFAKELPIPFFDNLSFDFAANKMHFIRGKNGAGKSTLFRLLRGQVDSTEELSGLITVHGKTYDLAYKNDRAVIASSISIVHQRFDLMLAGNFTFIENLQLARMPRYPGLTNFPPPPALPSLVHRFGISADTPASLLSGGQRQILAILMTLQQPATILLLDEPTAALDAKNSTMVMQFIAELLKTRPELTVIIICHDKELVETYAHNQYLDILVSKENVRTISAVQLR